VTLKIRQMGNAVPSPEKGLREETISLRRSGSSDAL
jgi:hypothetical protein